MARKTQFTRGLVVVFAIGIALACMNRSAASFLLPEPDAAQGMGFVPSTLVVKFKQGAGKEACGAFLAQAGPAEIKRLEHLGLSIVRMGNKNADQDLCAGFLQDEPSVEWVEKIPMGRFMHVPPDPEFFRQ